MLGDTRPRHHRRPGGPTPTDVRLFDEARKVTAKRRQTSAIEKLWPSWRSPRANAERARAPFFRPTVESASSDGRLARSIIASLCSPYAGEALLEKRRHDLKRVLIRILATAPPNVTEVVHYLADVEMAMGALDEFDRKGARQRRTQLLHDLLPIAHEADRLWLSLRDVGIVDQVITEKQAQARDAVVSGLVCHEARFGEPSNPLKQASAAVTPEDFKASRRKPAKRIRQHVKDE